MTGFFVVVAIVVVSVNSYCWWRQSQFNQLCKERAKSAAYIMMTQAWYNKQIEAAIDDIRRA